ncbi:MAG: anaerobic ribonucleoside-triphosphate reductase activating protein [Bdellovibrionaceae bacterium]|nr:anaerobic ribonucleoside-triphosphate reductase activating protein [Pseudobdellovibrionaceae bacterium]
MMFTTKQIVFREVPEEISLSFLISGCRKRCPGCHSSHSWPASSGQLLSQSLLDKEIEQYKNFITCVLFLGGDWEAQTLVPLLMHVQNRGLKTALYSGEDHVPSQISAHLNYLKLGTYIQKLGGLNNPETNQRIYNLDTGKCLNSYFQTRRIYDPIEPRADPEKNEIYRPISSA